MVQAGRAIFATGGVGVGAKGALETGKAGGFTGVFLIKSGGAGDAGGGVGGVAVALFAGAVLAGVALLARLTSDVAKAAGFAGLAFDAADCAKGRPTGWAFNTCVSGNSFMGR